MHEEDYVIGRYIELFENQNKLQLTRSAPDEKNCYKNIGMGLSILPRSLASALGV